MVTDFFRKINKTLPSASGRLRVIGTYRHIGSKSTNHSLLAWRREGQKVTLVAMIGRFRSHLLPPFSLIRDFGKQNTRGNVSKISVNHTCYRHVGSKSTNHSPLAWRREDQKVTLVAVIGGFRSDMLITCMSDGNFGNVSASVLFSKVAYQRKRW